MKEEKYIDSDGQVLTKKTWNNGTICYTNKQGLTHRLDGPADIWKDGSEIWYKDGKIHRLDAPAWINPNGTLFWYLNGKLHREDGPAWICSNGTEKYYLEGKEYSKEKYYKKIGKSNQDISITKDEGYITIKIKV